MLGGLQFFEFQHLINGIFGQRLFFFSSSGRRLHARVAIKFQNPATYAQLKIVSTDQYGRADIVRIGHLTGNKLAPDQLVEPFRISLHSLQGR